MSELKPCPFCGEMPMLFDRPCYYYQCIKEKCQGQEMSWNNTAQEALVSWNTRPIEDALQSRIAEMEAENKYLGNMPVNTVKAPDAIIYDNALDANTELRITVQRQQDRIAELEAMHDHQHLLDLADEMAKLQAENAKLVRELLDRQEGEK